MNYSLEFLSKEFEKHAKKAEEGNHKSLEEFIKNNPGEEIPEWFTNDFILPLALKTIVDQLIKTQDLIDPLGDIKEYNGN